jgi:hypothetical protein
MVKEEAKLKRNEKLLMNKNYQEISHQVFADYGKLPLSFILNKGQQNDEVKYHAQGGGFQCRFGTEKIWFTVFQSETDSAPQGSVHHHSIKTPRLKRKGNGMNLVWGFLGANPAARPEGRAKQAGIVNFLRGNDPTQWITAISTYNEVAYRELWPGIDLVFHGFMGQLKYDLVLQPAAKVEDIRIVSKQTGRETCISVRRLGRGQSLSQ